MGTNTMISLSKHAALIVVALLGLMLAAPAASAQDQTEIAPEHLALARRYVELTDKSNVYEVALVETAVRTMETIIRTDPNNTGIIDATDTAISTTLTAWKERKGELFDQFARNYALVFSVEELQEIVSFYESPVGQKLASANASINESQQMVMQVFQANLRTEFLAQVRAELKKAGYNF